MINRVVLVGRLTRDPEVRKTGTGMSVASFTVAVDNRTKGPNGEKTSSFIPCTAWNQTADFASRYAHKGNLVGVEGRLNQRTYDSRDGRKVTVIEVICDSFQMLESKAATQNAAPAADFGFEPDAVPSDVEEGNTSSIAVDDDLPF